MGFAEWLGLRPLERREDPPPSDPSSAVVLPSRNPSRSTVTVGEALSVSNVYRAVSILAIAAKQMSLDAFRGSVPVSPAPLLLRQPDPEETRSAFIEATVVSLASTGNAYWRIGRNEAGNASTLAALNPLDMTIDATSSGRVKSYEYQGRALAPTDIKHLKLLRVPGAVKGLGPIQAAQAELRGALDLRDYAANWFQDSGIPTGVLTTDQVINADQASTYKSRWLESQGGQRSVAVLGNGLNYEPVFLSPTDAQFLENQQFTVTQIARLFGVPSSLMLATVEGNTQTYQNVAQDWLGFVRFSLMSYLKEIEEALSSLLPRGQEARFNVEALLRSDTTTRYAAHKVAIDAGFMTIPEIRAIENLAPLEPAA